MTFFNPVIQIALDYESPKLEDVEAIEASVKEFVVHLESITDKQVKAEVYVDGTTSACWKYLRDGGIPNGTKIQITK